MQENLDTRVESRSSESISKEELNNAMAQSEGLSGSASRGDNQDENTENRTSRGPSSNETEASTGNISSQQLQSPPEPQPEPESIPISAIPVVPTFIARRAKPAFSSSSSVTKGPSFKPKANLPKKKPAAKESSQVSVAATDDGDSSMSIGNALSAVENKTPEESQHAAPEESLSSTSASKESEVLQPKATAPAVLHVSSVVTKSKGPSFKPKMGKPIMTAAAKMRAEVDASRKIISATHVNDSNENELVHEGGVADSVGGDDPVDD
jgi:hypothetical protein